MADYEVREISGAKTVGNMRRLGIVRSFMISTADQILLGLSNQDG